MTRVVVDTDVASFIFKNHPIGALYEPHLAGCTLLISFMTVAELDRWAIQFRWGDLAPRMVAAVSRTIRAAAVQPQALHDVGRGDRGRPGARVPDRVRRRLDRRHGIAARRAPCHAQPRRLLGRTGIEASFPRVNSASLQRNDLFLGAVAAGLQRTVHHYANPSLPPSVSASSALEPGEQGSLDLSFSPRLSPRLRVEMEPPPVVYNRTCPRSHSS